MRLTHQLLSILSEDNAQIEQMFDQKLQLDDTGVTTYQAGVRTLAALADESFDFASVTDAKYVIVIAYAEVQIRLNTATVPVITLKPNPAASAVALTNVQKADQAGRLFLGPTSIQTLELVNPSATDTARVFVAVVGEAV